VLDAAAPAAVACREQQLLDWLLYGGGQTGRPLTDLELATPAAPGGHRRGTARTPNDRWATSAFVAVVVVALPFYLALSRNVWFNNDDWDYLATRSAGSLQDLFRPHNEHWQTLPILLYRGMWHLFGLDHYQLYALPVVVLHLTAGVLLWIIIRRVGVRPWIATLVGSVFVLYGAGFQDIIWDFQVGFNAALVFGLAQLLLADHDGRVDRRDYLAIACGVLGLMCAGLAVTMVFIVGLAMLLRRGWRVALLQVIPPTAVFAVWWMWIGRDAYGARKWSVSETLQFVWRGITTAFENVGWTSGTAALLLLVLAVGLTLAWWQSGSRESRIHAFAVPGAMLVGALVFLAVAGYGRADSFGIEFAERSRYGHIVLALSSPAIAVAVNALTNLRRAAGVVIAALLVAGIPTNLNTVANARFGDPDVTMAMAHAPLARQVPASDRPDLTGQPRLTVGWLVDNADAGRIPKSNPSPTTAAEATIRLSLEQQHAPIAKAASCVPLGRKPVERRLAKGQQLQSKGGRLQVAQAANGRSVGRVIYRPYLDSIALKAVAPIDLWVAAATTEPTMLCA
jgi:hypothetical protein